MHRSLIASKPPIYAHRFSSAARLRTLSDDWSPLSPVTPQISSGGIPDVFSGGGEPFGQSEIVSIYGDSFGADLGLISTLGRGSCILLAPVASYPVCGSPICDAGGDANGDCHE